MSSVAQLTTLVQRLNARLALTEVTVPPFGQPNSGSSLGPLQGGATLGAGGRGAAGPGVNDAVNGLVTQWIVCVRDLLSTQEDCLTTLKAQVAVLEQNCASVGTAQQVKSAAIPEGDTSAVLTLSWPALLSMLQEVCLTFVDAADAAVEVSDFDFAIYNTSANATAGTFAETDSGLIVLINNGAAELVGANWVFKVASLGFLGTNASNPTNVYAKYRPNTAAGAVATKVCVILKAYEIPRCLPVA